MPRVRFSLLSDEESHFETTAFVVRDILNQQQNLTKRKRDFISFLFGYREYFENKFVSLTDEKVIVSSLSHMILLRGDLSDFVYLIFKNLGDKVIQKSLRILLKNIADDPGAIQTLCDHLMFWKQQNFTKTGSDTEKFSLDFLILKQLDSCFEQLDLNREILQKLT